MKIKTSELSGAALDWAVAKAEGLLCFGYRTDGERFAVEDSDGQIEGFMPSRIWLEGGPIIEREKIRLDTNDHPDLWPWVANKLIRWEKREDEEMGDWPVYAEGCGDTPLIAAMRCYVASKLGDEIDVPDEIN
jgi:hypothetical protein